MTREEIIEMAKQVGVDATGSEYWPFFIEELVAFAKLVEKRHREKDREDALAYLRMLHDSFSLASKDKP